MSQEADCKQCLVSLSRLEAQVGMLQNSIMKVVYALLAMAGANIGIKYIGTPWYVEVAMYSAVFSALFVLLITAAKWRCLSFWEKWIRISFVVSITYAFILRVYHYNTNTPFTQFEGIFRNLFDCALAVGFIILAWKRDSNLLKNMRRYDDL